MVNYSTKRMARWPVYATGASASTSEIDVNENFYSLYVNSNYEEYSSGSRTDVSDMDYYETFVASSKFGDQSVELKLKGEVD